MWYNEWYVVEEDMGETDDARGAVEEDDDDE